eukprot:100384_1
MTAMSTVGLFILMFAFGTDCYLQPSQINALEDFYASFNGDEWTECTWNITQLAINKTLPSYYCGLYIDNVTNNNTQTISEINFYFDNNLNGTIPNTIDKLVDLQGISIQYNELLSGNIPSTICNLNNLSELDFESVNLSGNIPTCIGNISSLETIIFVDIPYLKGTFPSNIIKNNDNLEHFEISNTALSGNISINSLCNNKELVSLWITYSPFLSPFIIPQCIKLLNNLMFLLIGGSSSIHGTIPNEICYLKYLFYLQIFETSISGTIPQCIQYNLTNLFWVDFHSNNLNGEFPPITSNMLSLLTINNNSFSGSISSIFCMDQYPTLLWVTLHKNNFYDNDVGIFITKLFKYSTMLEVLTIYDNDYIGGKFPDFSETEINLDSFIVFAAHKLNIGGVLSSNLHFAKTPTKKIISIYDNQLSSTLPLNLYNTTIYNTTKIRANITPIILRGNLFTIYDNHDIPEWMNNSQFINNSQLFLTLFDILKSYFILIIGFLSFILILIKKKINFV